MGRGRTGGDRDMSAQTKGGNWQQQGSSKRGMDERDLEAEEVDLRSKLLKNKEQGGGKKEDRQESQRSDWSYNRR
jgi:hypothetical protein